MAGWSDRVTIVPGDDGIAYAPGEILIRAETPAELNLAGGLLGFARTDPDQEEPIDRERWQALPGSYFLTTGYRGDIPSTIRRLRAAGVTAQPNHIFFADSQPGPYAANGVGANPVYANPVYANPVYANPVYANPVYANPVYANPVYANPVYANPVYANPVYANPVYANPVYANPGGAVAGGQHIAYGYNNDCGCGERACLCEPAVGAASTVYPNPILARSFYDEQAARSYQLNGIRPSNAIPYSPDASVDIPANEDWDSGCIRVAVIDTGWPSPELQLIDMYGTEEAESGDLEPTVTANSGNTLADGDLPDVENDQFLDPVAGHGMFIAGLILQYAPKVSVQVVKALTTYGDGKETEIAEAIRDLIPPGNRPDVISLSFGTYAPEEPGMLGDAIRAAISEDIVVVASAGNDGRSCMQYPAGYPGVVSVAALGPSGPAAFSNWGDWVRACAPGVDVGSAFWGFAGKGTDSCCRETLYEGWAQWSGTSFAAPIVAATLARYMTENGRGHHAVTQLVDDPRLYRIPCYGTVINPPAVPAP